MQVASLAPTPRPSLAGEPPAPESAGGGFAQLLGQQQASAADAPRVPSERADADESADAAPDDRAVRDRTSRPRTPAKPAARAEAKREGETAGRADAATAKTEESPHDGTTATSDEAALRSWLATLHLPHHDGATPAPTTTAPVGAETPGATDQPEVMLDAAAAGAAAAASSMTSG